MRKFRIVSVSCHVLSALLVCLDIAAQAQRVAPPTDTFTFLAVSDTPKSGGSSDQMRRLVTDAAQMNPKPSFVVDTGDLTETGQPAEYASFKQTLVPFDSAGIRFFAVPGSHDIRWSPTGKESFTKTFGKLYQSFDQSGVHFIMLDTTVALEHWGHLDKSQLDWLARDVKKLRVGIPIFVFMHHWLGRDTPSTRMIDNEYDLINILRGRNVIAIFTAHGKQDLVWQTNGIKTLMARGLSQGSYYRVTVTPLLATIDRFTQENPGVPVSIASLPIAHKALPSILRAEWWDPDVPYLARRRPQARLLPRTVIDNPDKEHAEYRVDDGPFLAMTKDNRDKWTDVFQTKNISIGQHTADIHLTTSNNVTHIDELNFEIERDNKEATRRWAINLNGPIQSSPLLSGSTVYVASVDGKCTALNTVQGKRRWEFKTKGEFLTTPTLSSGTIYVGSTDHFLYALEAESGKLRWKYDTGSPVLASAAVAQGVVCIGVTGTVYGLDAASGKMKWVQPIEGFFQSRVASDANTFYLGGWNNALTAVDAATGHPRWSTKMGSTFYFSPAISSPAVADGRVYICSNDGVLHCVLTTTGKPAWEIHAPAASDPFGYSSPVVVGSQVIVAGLGDSGNVYSFNTSNGKVAWSAATGQPIYDSSPGLSPDAKSMAIIGVRGRVSVLDTHSGKRLWGYELGPGNVFSTPQFDGDTVYTTTMANDVQALNRPGYAGPAHRAVPPVQSTEIPTTRLSGEAARGVSNGN